MINEYGQKKSTLKFKKFQRAQNIEKYLTTSGHDHRQLYKSMWVRE